MKAEDRIGRNYLKGRGADCINAVLIAAGYTSVCSSAGSRGLGVP